MFDLQPGIGLDKGEWLIAAATVDQKLKGAGIGVANLTGKAHRGVQDLITQTRIKCWRRGNLNNLLKASLYAALAFIQMHDVAGLITEDLHLHMACLANELLDVDITIAEGELGFRTATLIGGGNVAGTVHHAGATTTATVGGFDHHVTAITQCFEECLGFRQRDSMIDATNDWHVGINGRFSRTGLVSKELQHLG